MLSKNQDKGLLRNIASLGIVQAGNYILPLISVPIVSRIIGPENFGAINYAASFISYFTLLIAFGFDLTATRRIAHDPHNITLRSQVFSEVLNAQVFLFALSTGIFAVCLFYIPILDSNKEVAIASFLLCVSTVFTQNWLFQAMQMLHKVAILNLISKLLFTITILLIVRHKQDYIWQPFILSFAQISISIISFIWAIKMFHIELKFISFRFILNLLRAESTVFFSMIVINLYTITNTVMLGWLRPVEEVGYYTAALRLLLVATSIVNIPLAQAFYPYIGQAFGVSKEYGIQKVVKMIPIIFWLTVVMSCCMFTCGPTILLWFYGPAFSQSLPVFKILAFAPVIIAFSNIFGIQVMLNLKMDKSFFWITAGGAILGLCLNFLMTSSFGYVGTAWNWFIVEIYVTFSMYVYLKRSGIELISIRNFNPGASYAHIKPLFLKMIKR